MYHSNLTSKMLCADAILVLISCVTLVSANETVRVESYAFSASEWQIQQGYVPGQVLF
jgi:hypothetical protein